MHSIDYIMCGFYCIGFIEVMLEGRTVLGYANLFSPNDFRKTGKIIYNYFKDKIWQKKIQPLNLD